MARRTTGRRGILLMAAMASGCLFLLATPPMPVAAAPNSLSGRTIVLNPEEGGSDPGGIAGGVEEKNINLPTTLDVGALLTQAGATVVYTRSTDASVSLQARAALANQVHADAFITIAANTLNDPNFSGSITFYGPGSGYVGGVTRSSNLVAASRDLAQDVQNGVLQATGEVDRGVQSANFYVLGYAQVPAILIETGFMTNPPELQKLVTPAYQETIAEGIASGLAQFFSGQPASTTQPAVTADGQAVSSPVTVAATTPDAADAFSPFWVETVQGTTLWSAADPSGSAVVPLGQWSYLQVTGPQQGSRMPVTEPASQQAGFVDASAVGPAGPPPAGYTPPPVQPPFQPFWVETTQATALYSGVGDRATAFGTVPQWSPLLVLAPQSGVRFYVRNPATGGAAYVNASVVGPSGPPNGTSAVAPATSTATAAPPTSTAPPAVGGTTSYVVKVGDTLAKIGHAFGVSAAAIAQASGLADPNHIVVGTTLQIPGGTPVFQPFWVANFAKTVLWSGTDGNAARLGVAPQFTPMHVLAPETGNRYLVTVWTTGGQAYVDTNIVGPIGPPKGSS